ncbi:MAG: hypothetical protein R2864_11285 [Syntrophotaleaceae bacterium]
MGIGSNPLGAASFTVDTTSDSVDVNPGDSICADSDGSCSLRAAVMEANALAGADAIALPAGTYPKPGRRRRSCRGRRSRYHRQRSLDHNRQRHRARPPSSMP